MMSQVVIGEQCDCPEDCDSVTYTKFETSKDLNAEELCSDTTSWVYKHMKNTKSQNHAVKIKSFDIRNIKGVTDILPGISLIYIIWTRHSSLALKINIPAVT